MAKKNSENGKSDEHGNTVQSNEKNKAEVVDFQGDETQGGKNRSSWESAVLDVAREALGSGIDGFVDELPPEKQDWLKSIKGNLDKEIPESKNKNSSPEIKLNIVRIEIDREISRIKKAREPANENPTKQPAESRDEKDAKKNKNKIQNKYKNKTPFNMNQLLMRRTLI